MYDKNQFQDASFIDDAEILGTLEQAKPRYSERSNRLKKQPPTRARCASS